MFFFKKVPETKYFYGGTHMPTHYSFIWR